MDGSVRARTFAEFAVAGLRAADGAAPGAGAFRRAARPGRHDLEEAVEPLIGRRHDNDVAPSAFRRPDAPTGSPPDGPRSRGAGHGSGGGRGRLRSVLGEHAGQRDLSDARLADVDRQGPDEALVSRLHAVDRDRCRGLRPHEEAHAPGQIGQLLWVTRRGRGRTNPPSTAPGPSTADQAAVARPFISISITSTGAVPVFVGKCDPASTQVTSPTSPEGPATVSPSGSWNVTDPAGAR